MARSASTFWIDVHFWLGVVTALPLLAVAVTGGVLALQPELQAWTFPETYGVLDEGSRMSPVEAARLLEEEYPEADVYYVGSKIETGKPWIVHSSAGKLVIDPYGRTIRPAPEGGGWIGTVEEIHRNLTAGTVGRYVVAGSSIVLLLILGTGLWVWLPMWRGTLRRWWRKGSALGWHNVVGLATLPLLALMAVTGVMLTFGLASYLSTLTLSPEVPEPHVEPSSRREPVSLARAVRAAQGRRPDSRVVGFAEPWNPNQAVRVFMTRTSSGTRGWVTVFVHPYSGEVILSVDAYAHSWGAMLQKIWFGFHTGDVLGLGGRTAWGLASLLLPVLLGTGLWRWWKKRRARRRARRVRASTAQS